MKKILLASLFLITGSVVIGQKKEMENLNKLILFKKLDDAKKEVDKLLADPKFQDNNEFIVMDAVINAEISVDSAAGPKYPDAISKSYAALMKYYQKDTSLAVLKENPNGLRALSILYSNYFNEGREGFSKQDWGTAFNEFKTAESLGDIISKHNLGSTKQNIDTFAVLYTAYSAQNAKKMDDAVKYYKKFADEKIGGTDYIDVYKVILNYCTENKQPDFQKYLAIAKALYPDQLSVWNAFEMDNLSRNSGVSEMITKYKNASTGDLTAQQYAGYGEFFANVPKDELSKMDSATQIEIKNLGSDAFKKAFEKDNTNGIYAFNAGVLLYQQFSALQDKFYENRGTDPKLKAIREQIEQQQQGLADASLDLMEKSYNILKAKYDNGTPDNRDRVEISCLSKSVDFLAVLYEWKRDRARGKAPQDYDKYDAKFKLFDAEHGKYN